MLYEATYVDFLDGTYVLVGFVRKLLFSNGVAPFGFLSEDQNSHLRRYSSIFCDESADTLEFCKPSGVKLRIYSRKDYLIFESKPTKGTLDQAKQLILSLMNSCVDLGGFIVSEPPPLSGYSKFSAVSGKFTSFQDVEKDFGGLEHFELTKISNQTIDSSVMRLIHNNDLGVFSKHQFRDQVFRANLLFTPLINIFPAAMPFPYSGWHFFHNDEFYWLISSPGTSMLSRPFWCTVIRDQDFGIKEPCAFPNVIVSAKIEELTALQS
jgi:hypothetical protein